MIYNELDKFLDNYFVNNKQFLNIDERGFYS